MKFNDQSPTYSRSRVSSVLHKFQKTEVSENVQQDKNYQEEVDAEYDHFVETWESFREFFIHG